MGDATKPRDLTVQIVHIDDAPVVIVGGEVDLSSADTLRTSLARLDGRVLVNLSGVSFMDSSGLSVLAAAHNRLTANGGDLRLRSPQKNVRRTLDVVGMTEWIVEDRPQAPHRHATRPRPKPGPA